jgi:hypothetical protein
MDQDNVSQPGTLFGMIQTARPTVHIGDGPHARAYRSPAIGRSGVVASAHGLAATGVIEELRGRATTYAVSVRQYGLVAAPLAAAGAASTALPESRLRIAWPCSVNHRCKMPTSQPTQKWRTPISR